MKENTDNASQDMQILCDGNKRKIGYETEKRIFIAGIFVGRPLLLTISISQHCGMTSAYENGKPRALYKRNFSTRLRDGLSIYSNVCCTSATEAVCVMCKCVIENSEAGLQDRQMCTMGGENFDMIVLKLQYCNRPVSILLEGKVHKIIWWGVCSYRKVNLSSIPELPIEVFLKLISKVLWPKPLSMCV